MDKKNSKKKLDKFFSYSASIFFPFNASIYSFSIRYSKNLTRRDVPRPPPPSPQYTYYYYAFFFLYIRLSQYLALPLIISPFLTDIRSKQQPPLNPRSIPPFPFPSLVFRPYPLYYSHLRTLIYFLYLLNFRKTNFSQLKKFFSINKKEISELNPWFVFLVYSLFHLFFIVLSDLSKISTFSPIYIRELAEEIID